MRKHGWTDLVPTALKTGHVPGAVVVIVKDGQVLLEKGYGFADYEKRIPVDPRTTLFRPGSTSKLFTWTAVMQLVEQGKLDLDADVNSYLDVKMPARGGRPVTLREIMTHRAGFEETIRDLLTFDDSSPVLADAVKHYVPPRIWDPSRRSGLFELCDHGGGLYRPARIRTTVRGLHRTTRAGSARYAQFNFPPAAAAGTARPDVEGYETSEKPGAGYEIVSMAPAGALASSGEDMAHFMIAHLQLGRYGDHEILKPETAQLMQTTITKALPDLNGNAFGFYEQNINGHRVIAHGGDTNYFHSDLSLFLDDHVGCSFR